MSRAAELAKAFLEKLPKNFLTRPAVDLP